MKRDTVLRRDKSDPASDMWHTLKVGAVIFALVILPGMFVADWQIITPQEKARAWIKDKMAVVHERMHR